MLCKRLNRNSQFKLPLLVLIVSFQLITETKAADQYSWQFEQGSWTEQKNSLQVNCFNSEAFCFYGNNQWQNYIIEVDATFLKVKNNSRWVSIIFRAGPDGNQPWSQCPLRFDAQLDNAAEFAVKKKDKWHVRKNGPVTQNNKLNKSFHLKVIVNGPEVKFYHNGQWVINSFLCIDRNFGAVGLGASGCVARFENFNVTPLPNSTIVQHRDDQPACKIIAHRGFSYQAPENTIAAIKAAAKTKCFGSEFDVRQTKDGATVLMHDPTVNRTTNGKGKLSHFTLSQLERLNTGTKTIERYHQEPIPTLNNAISTCKENTITPVVEIKEWATLQNSIYVINQHQMNNPAYVISFDGAIIQECNKLAPKIATAWLCDKIPSTYETPHTQSAWILKQLKTYRTNTLNISYKLLSPKMIELLHKKNIQIWVFVLNDPQIAKVIIQWGADAITTDRPDLLMKLDNTYKVKK
ncbi:MAG: glycerophosphodiester phosphodiesterase family protein [Planctomycetota bacterium]|jgi:glycerophosphoryl diester phosphodiesterase